MCFLVVMFGKKMRNNTPRCACGLPLHYQDKQKQAEIEAAVNELGEWMPVHVGNDRYLAQRHYIALHGLKGNQIESLVKQGIMRRE